MLGHPKFLLSKGISPHNSLNSGSELEEALFPEAIFECYPDPLAEMIQLEPHIFFQISWFNHQLFSYFLKKETHRIHVVYIFTNIWLKFNAGKYP